MRVVTLFTSYLHVRSRGSVEISRNYSPADYLDLIRMNRNLKRVGVERLGRTFRYYLCRCLIVVSRLLQAPYSTYMVSTRFIWIPCENTLLSSAELHLEFRTIQFNSSTVTTSAYQLGLSTSF